VNDVVLYTAAFINNDADGVPQYEVQSVMAAPSVTVTPTARDAQVSFTAGGRTFFYSARNANWVEVPDITANRDFVIFQDEFENVIMVRDPIPAIPRVGVVLANRQAPGDGWTAGASEVRLIQANGEVTEVRVAANTHTQWTRGMIVTYGLPGAGGIVTLTQVTNATAAGSTGWTPTINTSITRNSAQIVRGSGAWNAGWATPEAPREVNARTFFIVETGTVTAPVYTVYTGIFNVPNVRSAEGSNYAAPGTTGGIAHPSVVFVSRANVEAVVTEITFVASRSSIGHAPSFDTVQFFGYQSVVNGEIVPLRAATTWFAGNGGIFQAFTRDADQRITGGTRLQPGPGRLVQHDVLGITRPAPGSSVITLGGLPLSFNTDTLVYTVSSLGVITQVAAGVPGITAAVAAVGGHTSVAYYTTGGILSAIFIRLP
jgi:hypothetical protein